MSVVLVRGFCLLLGVCVGGGALIFSALWHPPRGLCGSEICGLWRLLHVSARGPQTRKASAWGGGVHLEAFGPKVSSSLGLEPLQVPTQQPS